MQPRTLLEEIDRLPVDERIRLVEHIWDSIAATPEAVPVPECHKAELDKRLYDPSVKPSLSPEELRARLRQLE